jgi:hypothetical protein
MLLVHINRQEGEKMVIFNSFSGIITMIDDFWTGDEQRAGCYKIMRVESPDGNLVNFIVQPTTYFVGHVMVAVGDMVTGYYDANAPVPAIYPPQLRAIVMARVTPNQNVKVDYFNSQLISSDGSLKLNIAPDTRIVLENGQAFTGDPANRDLIVVYGPTTRSIPAQTAPYEIIVLCYGGT